MSDKNSFPSYVIFLSCNRIAIKQNRYNQVRTIACSYFACSFPKRTEQWFCLLRKRKWIPRTYWNSICFKVCDVTGKFKTAVHLPHTKVLAFEEKLYYCFIFGCTSRGKTCSTCLEMADSALIFFVSGLISSRCNGAKKYAFERTAAVVYFVIEATFH
jgi:hypothetical protein